MSLRIHNTLTQTKEIFTPVRPGKVSIYLCGPTVYKPSHIGHAVGPVIFDTVKRYFKFKGFDVTWVVNITDVDDKLIAEAREQGCGVLELAQRVTAGYLEAMAQLGVTAIDHMPKASEHIAEIVAMCERLIAKGAAYVSGGDVYFDVTACANYGKLSHRRPEDQQSGTRDLTGEQKRNPGDFALWKGAKPDEPAEVQFDSPWGKGRPGWHIECSAMTGKYLGIPLDIHGGGKDLVFPHHTNEIAQSVAASSERLELEAFARYWMHHGFVEIDSEKMSKSLGNFFTIREVLAKYDAEALRLFLLGTHYRNPINYSDAILGEAEVRLRRLYETLDRVDRMALGATPRAGKGPMAALVSRANEALDDDFNTAAVLGFLAEAFTAANALADRKGKKTPDEKAALAAVVLDARQVGKTLGILQRCPAEALVEIRDRAAQRIGIDRALVARKLAERAEARRGKDFARADAIRGELQSMGVAIMDGPEGTSWSVEQNVAG